MQRENNFRGQTIDDKEWVYGYLVKDSVGTEYIITDFGCSITACSDCGMPSVDFYEVIPETVGQYTDLKDWYQGDILDLSFYFVKSKGIIRYGEYEQENKYSEYFPYKNIGFYIETADNACRIDLGFFNKAVKVGTIHDNPELLQEVDSNGN